MPEADGEAIRPAGWRKSSHSNRNGECVQIAKLPNGRIAVRNSRRPSGPVLVFAVAEMSALVQSVKNGELET